MRCSSTGGQGVAQGALGERHPRPPAAQRHGLARSPQQQLQRLQRCHRHLVLVVLLALAGSSSTRSVAGDHGWHHIPHPHPKHAVYKPTLSVPKECPDLKIAVVNGVNFHFEVLAGLLHVLNPYAHQTDVYLSPHAQTQNFNGAWELVRGFPGVFKKTSVEQVTQVYDMAILVSPDYELQDNIQLLQVMKPAVLVAYVHNAGFNVSRLEPLASLRLRPLTLSPHVADALNQAAGRTDAQWLLPVFPWEVYEDCLTFPDNYVLGLCLRGFAMQGKFSNLRRNYSSVWRQMTERIDTIKDPQVGRVFFINVLGKGQDRLNVPPVLEQHIKVHRRLIYSEFFNAIAHNVALLPSLAGNKYYTEKFSSTMLTSLITGTPVLASTQLLQAYRFFTPETVYLQQEGEEEIDAMVRMSRQSAADIIKVRVALLKLRDELNLRAGALLEGMVQEACKASVDRVSNASVA